LQSKELNPNAQILVHPECTPDVVQLGDYVGSTSGIIQYATESTCTDFIVCTEIGILHQLKKKNPQKHFYTANSIQYCPNMKRITLNQVHDVLKNSLNSVSLDEETSSAANLPLHRMLELAQ